MTISIDSLPLSFTVSGVQFSSDVDVSINILRRREEILYKSNTDQDKVNISYFASRPLNSLSTLLIADRSTSLVANRIESEGTLSTIENKKTAILQTDRFLVTDEIIESFTTSQPVPLFFKHIIDTTNLPRVASDNDTINANSSLLEVRLLDSLFNEIKNADIKIDRNIGYIYNNLESKFDAITGNFTAFYVQYTVRTKNEICTYTDILDNINTFQVALFSDLDENVEIIQDGRKVYLVEEVGQEFLITLPVPSTYIFKITNDAKIKIVPPPPSDINNPWRVSVTNGQFFTNLQGSIFKYSLPEFLNQQWNPFAPIKKVDSETSLVISSTLIKLNRNDIHEDLDNSLFVEILISDKDNNALAAFTTDTSKNDTLSSNKKNFQVWDRVKKIGIRSIDHLNGFVDIEGFVLKSSYKITSTYYFEETNFEFSVIDFNPINNVSVLKQRVSLFVIPDTIFTNRTQNLFYLISDQSGRVIDSNWVDFTPQDQTVNGFPLYYEEEPDFITSGLGGEIFVDKYSTEVSGTFLILGDMVVSEELSPQESTTIDVRVRGGGIQEGLLEELRRKNPEVSWFWDIGFWDGTPYPGVATYFVEVPVSVMEDAGGTLRSVEIRDTVERHTAAGVYAIVKAYGVDPVISGVVPGVDSINISWNSNGSS